MSEEARERKRQRDRDRYWRNREERQRYAREYYRENREVCILRVRISEFRRLNSKRSKSEAREKAMGVIP